MAQKSLGPAGPLASSSHRRPAGHGATSGRRGQRLSNLAGRQDLSHIVESMATVSPVPLTEVTDVRPNTVEAQCQPFCDATAYWLEWRAASEPHSLLGKSLYTHAY